MTSKKLKFMKTILFFTAIIFLGLSIGFLLQEEWGNKLSKAQSVFFRSGGRYIKQNRLLHSPDYLERLESYYMLWEEKTDDLSFMEETLLREKVEINRETFIWIVTNSLSEKKVVDFYNIIYNNLNKSEKKIFESFFLKRFKKHLTMEKQEEQ